MELIILLIILINNNYCNFNVAIRFIGFRCTWRVVVQPKISSSKFFSREVRLRLAWTRHLVLGLGYARRKLGAENRTATVEIIVNSVNMIRHKRSTTIAANFQSFVISLFLSSSRSWWVEYRVNRVNGEAGPVCSRRVFISNRKEH